MPAKADGQPVSIGIPGSDAAEGVVLAGSVVYEGAAPDTAAVARPTEEGVQALVVLDGPEAPTTFRYPIEVGTRCSWRSGPDSLRR